MELNKFGLGIIAITGWSILTYIVWDSIPKGGYFIATNLFFEMWIEAILFPFFIILAIYLMVMKDRNL